MFSFFKRSKSQKGKQKGAEKLQLPPEKQQQQQLQPAWGESDPSDSPGRARKSSSGDAGFGENCGVKPPPVVGDGGGVRAPKVASDGVNAGANAGGPPAAATGDEEKQRAKNNNPHRLPPQPATVAGAGGTPECRPSAEGHPRSEGGRQREADVVLETGPRAPNATISPSGPTYASGSVTRTLRCASDGFATAERHDFPSPIDNDGRNGEDERDRDRESSSPIDDSGGCRGGTQANATSSNPTAPPSESAMAKGKNRRRYQQPQQQHHQHQHQQQQQQSQQQQQQQQQQVKAQNVLRRGDSSGGPEIKRVMGASLAAVPTHLSLAKVVTSIVVDQTAPIKGRQKEEEVEEGPINGDVETQPDPIRGPLIPITDSWCSAGGDDKDGDRVAKTHTTGDGGGGVALVLPCAAAAQPLTAGSTNTTTSSSIDETSPPSQDAAGHRETLLNIKNISPTPEEHGGAALSVVVNGAGPPEPECERTDSSEPAANRTISETNAVAVRHSSVEEAVAGAAPAAAAAAATIQEMGQQPSRTESDPTASQRARASKSISPQRVAAPPSPPPRSQRAPPSAAGLPDLEAIVARNATSATTTISSTVVGEQEHAAGDDTSDDRDVFYEAKETLSSGAPGVEPGAAGTPEPIRASLVLKIAEPIVGAGRRDERAGKKQVSFKLTQNGSDDVDVTSVADSASDEEDSDSEPPHNHHVHLTPNHDHQTAFSERANSVDSFGVNGSGKEEQGQEQEQEHGDKKRNYIEFQYENSAPDDKAAAGDGKTGGAEHQTSVLIEDSVASLPDVVQQPTSIDGKTVLPPASFGTVEKINSDMKDLVNQECRYSAKLEEAEKRVNDANAKVYELQQKLDAVERDALLKEYNVERLQAELLATLKECDGIRARLTTQQAEMEAIRLKASEREDELNLRYQNLEVEHLELNEKLKEVRHLAHDLNSQLIDAKSEVDRLQTERQKLLDERTEEQKIMREALEESIQQRAQVEAKWKHDFEQLRNVNNDREEHLMKDCEFTVRNMQKTCKEKVESADRERKKALEKVGQLEELSRKQNDEVRHLKSYEAEVEQLRGLTYDQKEALASMTRQVAGLKAELETAYNRLEEEMVKVQQIKNRCEYQLCEKEREALNRIEIARGEIAMQWEDRLLHEMNRLKVELEQMHMEERTSAIEKIRRETLAETEALSQRFNEREQQLKDEIESLKATVQQQKLSMSNAQSEADQKLIQSRMYVERAEREHEEKLARETNEKNEIIENLKRQFEKEKLTLEEHFTARIQQVQEEFAREISDTTELMKSAHKKELEDQWKALVAEKEEALQLMDSRNRNRLEDAENKIRELTTGHQRQLKDLQEEHSFVVHSLESRDTKNAQEIQTLHKKCRCLTNLFEEMRLRYERREPRQEDLQQIEELKRVIDSQDKDLRLLTETLREMQLEQMQRERQPQPPPPPRRSKPNRGKQSKQNQQQHGKQQQQQQQQKQTPKNSRPPHPLPEPEPMRQDEGEEDHRVDEMEEYGEQRVPVHPQVVLIPPPQVLIPPIVHRTMCDVIFEENEADILREEEEEQMAQMEEGDEQGQQQQQEEEEEEEEQMPDEVDEQKAVTMVVVDVPASAIQTEDRVIQSTTPTIIEDTETNSERQPELAETVGDGVQQCTVVVPSETIEDASVRPRASSTPRIIITDDTEKGASESDCPTVVEISEEPPTCGTPVIELPAVFAKIYPAEGVGDSVQTAQAAHSEPEMIVIRTSEGHGEGSS